MTSSPTSWARARDEAPALSEAVPPAPEEQPRPVVEIVVPVRNEEADLARSVRRLHAFLTERFPFPTLVTIADNGSTDGTWQVATELSASLPSVRAVHLDLPGRGRALAAVWKSSCADVLAYMDVDLSTDLNALLPLVAPLLSGHSDVAIGTRLSRGSHVLRGPKREIISRGYNLLLRATLRVGFSDAQCGFKAIRRDAAALLLPLVEDTSWFFDTELLVLAERCGLRIYEVPVDWVDDADSRVDIIATAMGDLRGILRVATGLARGRIPLPVVDRTAYAPKPALRRQLVAFAVIGVLSTLAYLLLYLALRDEAGGQVANAVSLVLTALLNTAANRRWTFGIRGRLGAARHQLLGLVVFGLCLALTSGALAVLHAVTDHASRIVEVSVLVAANLLATALRFLLYRGWVFASRRSGRSADGPADDASISLPAALAADQPVGSLR